MKQRIVSASQEKDVQLPWLDNPTWMMERGTRLSYPVASMTWTQISMFFLWIHCSYCESKLITAALLRITVWSYSIFRAMCVHGGVWKPRSCGPPPSMTWGSVLDSPWSCQCSQFVGFFLRQQSTFPVPVLQTGGGVEWDHRAASTNLFPSAAWLIRPVGVQLFPASGMYPPQLSEEFLLAPSGSPLVLGCVARQHGKHPDLKQLIKGVAGWSNSGKLCHCMGNSVIMSHAWGWTEFGSHVGPSRLLSHQNTAAFWSQL